LTKWQPNWLGGSNTAVTPPDNGQDLNCMSPSQVTESGGVLHLTAVARSCAASNGKTYQYASGLVNSYKTFNFTYGYMEARVYIPAASTGTGANFPAFWADGTGAWPTTGELDVMEVLGTCGLGWHFHSTLGAFGGCTPLAPSTGWHTVGANWQAGSVTYYYDGHKVGQIASGVTGAPMYVILNNSVDPTWGGPIVAPADMQVDYVRVWQ
jgi:beta-glucanase (GH16 family)